MCMRKWHANWSLDPIPRLMALASGLFLQAVGFSGKGSCLQALAATALLVSEAENLTLGE
jgi:hypothetical protein